MTQEYRNEISLADTFGGITKRLGRSAVAHPFVYLLLVAVLFVALLSKLPTLSVDTSFESYLKKDAPAISAYQEFKSNFGEDKIFLLLIRTPEIFEPSFIETLRSLQNELTEKTPYFDRADSLLNARHIKSENDSITISDLIAEPLTGSGPATDEVRDYAFSNPSFQNVYFSPDKQLVTLAVRLQPEVDGVQLNEKHLLEAWEEIEKVKNRYEERLGQEIEVAGGPIMQIDLQKIMERDFAVLTGLAVAMVMLVMAVIFRRLSSVLMPIAVLWITLLATMGTMATMGTPLQMTTSILPCFLLAVCVGDSVHFLSAFYALYDKGCTKSEAILGALDQKGTALLFTTLTTAAALIAFTTSKLLIVSNLGLYSAIGVVYAYFLTVILLPALIVLLPMRRRSGQSPVIQWFERLKTACTDLAVMRSGLIVFLGCSLLMLGAFFSSRLEFSQNTLAWLPEDNPARVSFRTVEEQLGGGVIPIEIVVDTGRTGGATDSHLLQKLDKSLQEISHWTEGPADIKKIVSLTDLIKEMNQALHDNDVSEYRIPDNSELINQELFVVEIEAPHHLFDYTDPNYQLIRASILVTWADALHFGAFSNRIEQYFTQNYAGFDVQVTGIAKMASQAFVEMLHTTAAGYALALGIITLMMILVAGNVWLGLLSMIPNLAPTVIVLGCMHLLGMPLDMFTLLIGSIALGVSVDDTVHFMCNFRSYYKQHGDTGRSIAQTLNTTGPAMLSTTLVLALGFLLYSFASLQHLHNFGLLTAACIVLALVADFILAPALMALLVKDGHPASSSIEYKSLRKVRKLGTE